MTNEQFHKDWMKYGVRIAGEMKPLKDHYCVCWGWIEQYKGMLFDTGGEQGATAHVLRVEDENLVSVNPENPEETSIIGRLELLDSNGN